MKEYSRREIVASALLRGKVQSKKYTRQSSNMANSSIFGTVAVFFKDGNYLVSIRELEDSAETYFLEEDWNINELHTISTLEAVDELLSVRLSMSLEELGPSKGINVFK